MSSYSLLSYLLFCFVYGQMGVATSGAEAAVMLCKNQKIAILP